MTTYQILNIPMSDKQQKVSVCVRAPTLALLKILGFCETKTVGPQPLVHQGNPTFPAEWAKQKVHLVLSL